MTKARLRCLVSEGQFNSEFMVVVTSFNGKRFSLYTPRENIVASVSPTDDAAVEGWISVDVLENKETLFLVMLPSLTLENGRFLTVSANQLDKHYPKVATHDSQQQVAASCA